MRSIDQYTTSDAAKLRDWLISRNLKMTSIKRSFSSIKSIINFTICGRGQDCKNAFQGVYIPQDLDKNKRLSLPLNSVKSIQSDCVIETMIFDGISNTGLRLAEAIGLMKSDINLNDDIPHVVIQPHPIAPQNNNDSQIKNH